jgi:hypothetical protein
MALQKQYVVGGTYYKGYKLTVLEATGDYTLDMTVSDRACGVLSIAVVPDTYGAGDYFKLEHLNSANTMLAVLASTVFNIGKSIAWTFDFPAIELIDVGDKFRLTYTNVAGTALYVYTNIERITSNTRAL